MPYDGGTPGQGQQRKGRKMENKIMTPSKALDTAVKQYILESISNDGYDNAIALTDEVAKLTFLKGTFKSEYGWAIPRYGEQMAFAEWIKGLPSSFNIAFTNYDILQLAIKWGYYGEKLTEKQEEEILDNYWNLITVKTFQLFKKYKIN